MVQVKFPSFDAYAAAIQHADTRMTLVGREQGNWALAFSRVSEISIQWGVGGAAACEGGSVRGGLTLFLPMYKSDGLPGNEPRLLGNGQRLESGSILILEPGADFCITATGAHRWSSIFVPFDSLNAMNVPADKTGHSHRLLSPSGAGENLQSLVENLGAILHNAPEALRSTSALGKARSKISEAISKALTRKCDVISTQDGHNSLVHT